MEETDISSYAYTKAIYFFNRSADYCIKKCGILSSNNNGKLTQAQEANLSKITWGMLFLIML